MIVAWRDATRGKTSAPKFGLCISVTRPCELSVCDAIFDKADMGLIRSDRVLALPPFRGGVAIVIR